MRVEGGVEVGRLVTVKGLLSCVGMEMTAEHGLGVSHCAGQVGTQRIRKCLLK